MVTSEAQGRHMLGGEWKGDAQVLVRHERDFVHAKKKRRERAVGLFLSNDFRTEQPPAYANSLTRTSVDYRCGSTVGGVWRERASLKWGKARTIELEVELFPACGRFVFKCQLWVSAICGDATLLNISSGCPYDKTFHMPLFSLIK